MRCAHMISLPAQSLNTSAASEKRGTQTAKKAGAAYACGRRINILFLFESGWHAKVNDGKPTRCDAETAVAMSERRAVTVHLTEEHLRKMIEDHLLKEE